jgi:hypothetical protein
MRRNPNIPRNPREIRGLVNEALQNPVQLPWNLPQFTRNWHWLSITGPDYLDLLASKFLQ